MAYYTGSVNTYTELLTALVNACTANGWTFNSGILSKGRAFVKPSVSGLAAGGLVIEGGTGQSGASLLNPSPQAARLGQPYASSKWPSVTWPAQYHIHLGTNPDEVYVVMNTNVTDFYWLAFGLSTVPMVGTGLWMAASAPRQQAGNIGASMTETSGAQNLNYGCPGIFWAPAVYDANYNSIAVQSAASGSWPLHTSVGINSLSPLIARYELTWNKAAVLLPAREYIAAPENKRQLLIDAAHARLVRLGSLEPGQILQLGPDRWRVYPFLRKDTSSPNSVSSNVMAHSGTFGWALRYDGP